MILIFQCLYFSHSHPVQLPRQKFKLEEASKRLKFDCIFMNLNHSRVLTTPYDIWWWGFITWPSFCMMSLKWLMVSPTWNEQGMIKILTSNQTFPSTLIVVFVSWRNSSQMSDDRSICGDMGWELHKSRCLKMFTYGQLGVMFCDIVRY